MKKVIYLLLCTLTCALIASSCHNDNEEFEDYGLFLEGIGTLDEGGYIHGLTMMCLEEQRSMSEGLYDEYAKTHILKDYEEMRLYLSINYKIKPYWLEFERNVVDLINKEIREYEQERTRFLVEDLKDFRKQNPDKPSIWTSPFSAYINGSVKITCDKTLFGLEPGTDLSKYFKIVDSDESIAVGIENPRIAYKYGEERPSNVAEYWTDETWIQYDYNLYLNQTPSEKYDKLTFRITMPLILENITDYHIAKVFGKEFEQRFTEKTLETDCYMFFNWD